jgi:hypothetical protein
MIDLYYKFPDHPTTLLALSANGMTYTDDEGIEHPSQGGHDFALWEVGTIEGIEGWHINVRLINVEFDVSGLEQYKVEPQKPVCIWA